MFYSSISIAVGNVSQNISCCLMFSVNYRILGCAEMSCKEIYRVCVSQCYFFSAWKAIILTEISETSPLLSMGAEARPCVTLSI